MTVPVAGLAVTPSIVLVRELGRGGMGAVWLADHTTLRRNVAVKLLDPDRRASEAAVRRFQREAASVASVKSVYVVSVQDAGISDLLGPYIVMELLEGRDLATVLETEGPLAPERVATIVDEVARGLAKVHEAGLVHRDVKAENVFLCEEAGEPEHAKVLDFGIALGKDDRLTEVGVTIGSRLSMSPEQAAGKPVGVRSDAYSLALLAFRMLTGHSAITRESLDALGLAAYRAERPRPSSMRPELSEAVDAWFSRATEPEPAARFEDVRALANALRAALEGVVPALEGVAPAREHTMDETSALAPPSAPIERHEPRETTAADTNDGTVAPPSPRAPPAVAPLPSPRPRARWGRVALAIVALAALAAVAALVRSFGTAATDASAAPDAAAALPVAPRELRLSLVLDVSGTNRKRGIALARASELAAAMVTEGGGVRGRALVVDTIDDQGDGGDFLRARFADAFARSEARVVLGPLLTVQTVPAHAVVRERAFLEVSASATGAALGAEKAFLGLAPSDDLQAAALAGLVRHPRPIHGKNAAPACKRVAIVASADAHGLPFANTLVTELARAPALATELVTIDPAPRRAYDAEVARALAHGTRCLVLLVSPKLGARVLLSVPPKSRPSLRVLAGDTLASNDFIELGRGDIDDTKSASVAEGVEGVAVGTSPPASAEYRTFRRRYEERFHVEADEPFAARQFDAVVLVAIALQRAGIDAPAPRIREAIIAATRGKHGYGPAEMDRLLRAVGRGEDVDYEGASGDLSFGPDERPKGTFDTWTVRGGKLVRTVD